MSGQQSAISGQRQNEERVTQYFIGLKAES